MEELLKYEFSESARHWITIVFFWSGFAAWVGVIVQFFDARLHKSSFEQPWLALTLGYISVSLGPVIARAYSNNDAFEPVSPPGIAASFLVAMVATTLYYVFRFLFPIHESEEEKVEKELNVKEEMRQRLAGMTRDELERVVMSMKDAEFRESERKK